MPSIARKTPWKDRVELLKEISSFTGRNGGTFRELSPRMSDLFEMSVYNDVVKFYRRKGHSISIVNLMKNGTFKFKLSPAGLSSNFSYFKVDYTDGTTIEVHHNIKVQSKQDEHIYYTADVSVTSSAGVSIVVQKNGKKHSFIDSKNLITFFEVKNMNPFPEILLNFNGVLLEILPEFVTNNSSLDIGNGGSHLTPTIVFSGFGSEYTQKVAVSLTTRYRHNIVVGSFATKGQIYNQKGLYTFA